MLPIMLPTCTRVEFIFMERPITFSRRAIRFCRILCSDDPTVGAIDFDRPYSCIFASATGGSGQWSWREADPHGSGGKPARVSECERANERSYLAKINSKTDN